jgi:hypothetical protein
MAKEDSSKKAIETYFADKGDQRKIYSRILRDKYKKKGE